MTVREDFPCGPVVLAGHECRLNCRPVSKPNRYKMNCFPDCRERGVMENVEGLLVSDICAPLKTPFVILNAVKDPVETL